VVDKITPVERIVSNNISMSIVAYLKPVITATNFGGPFDAGVPEIVSLSIENTAIPEPFEIVFNYPAGTVIVYGTNTYTCTSDGCPPISVTLDGETAVLSFTVTFDEAWTGDVGVNLYDSDWPITKRLLATASATGVVVNGNFVITGTFSMQGRVTRGGIPVTLTWTGTGWTYSNGANTVDELVNNFQVTVTYGGGYIITTNQPRYLNLTTASNKTITVNGAKTLNALMLRGGNVNNDAEIGLADAGIIGGVYGSTGDPQLITADANFDGRVNILDLALVGGNYNLTTASAYTTWLP